MKDKYIDLEKDLNSAMFAAGFLVSAAEALPKFQNKIKNWVNAFACLIALGWMSLLLIFIFTEKIMYLKVWGGIFVVLIMFGIFISAIASLFKFREPKLELDWDSADCEALNKKEFTDITPAKYLVTDKSESMYGKEVELYPTFSRVSIDKKTGIRSALIYTTYQISLVGKEEVK